MKSMLLFLNGLTLGTVLALLIFPKIGRADSLDTWTVRNPAPTANGLHGIVYGNNQFVAVGGGGVILTSSDSINWMPRQSSTVNALSGIAYGNGQFVAIGDAGTIVTSANGANWVQRVSGTKIPLLAVAYGNGQFVAVGAGYDSTMSRWGTAIVTSADGMNWVQRDSGTTGFTGIAYGNGVFVTVGDLSEQNPTHASIMTSADGMNWIQQQTPKPNGARTPDDALGAVTFGNGQFVAVNRPNGHNSFVLNSPDGVTWSLHYPQVANLSGLSYGNGQFVGTLDGDLATSADGMNWAWHPSGDPWDERYFSELYGVAYGNGQFVAVGDYGTILSSSDGRNWVRREPKDLIILSDITYGNGQFLAVGNWYNLAIPGWEAISEVSADGRSWTQSHVGPGTLFNNVAYGNRQFVASCYWSNAVSGLEGNILTSANGLDWIPQRSGTTNGLGAIAYGNGRFVALGSAGTVVSSSDGVNWVQGHHKSQIDPLVISYGNGQFLAWGARHDTNVILTSADGLNWEYHEYSSAMWVRSLACGNNQLVAVGFAWLADSNFIIRNSSDGLDWVEHSSGTSFGSSLNGVAYGSGYFVAVGRESDYIMGGMWRVHGPLIVLTSPDGVTWTQRAQSGAVIGPSAIAYGNGHFVAIGPGGTILQSGSAINLAIKPNADRGLLSLSLEGPIGLDYTIQNSTDLISWRDVTKINGAQSTKVILDGLTATSDRQFYRAFSP